MMKTITVKGVGNISAKPDYITISMTVESMDRDYEKAMDGAARRIESLKAAAVSVGYEKEALKTTSFNVETRYENVKDRQGNYKREFAGYACVYRLKLAFDFDSKQLAKVISAISGSEANPELSIAFTVKNPAKVSEELLISAAQNARAKAENFGEDMDKAVAFAHMYGVKAYLTLNTLIEYDPIEDLCKTIQMALSAKVDAFIVQDLGVVNILKNCFS